MSMGILIVVHVNCLVYVHDDVTVGVVGTLKSIQLGT